MTELSPVPLEGDDAILIEIVGHPAGFQPASLDDQLKLLQEKSQVGVELALGTIRAAARRFGRTCRALQHEASDLVPDEVEIEFVVKLELAGGVETGPVTALIAKADASGSAGGQFSVKFKWAGLRASPVDSR